MHMTKQSYQIKIFKKSPYLSSPELEPFFNENTAPAPAKYGGLRNAGHQQLGHYIPPLLYQPTRRNIL